MQALIAIYLFCLRSFVLSGRLWLGRQLRTEARAPAGQPMTAFSGWTSSSSFSPRGVDPRLRAIFLRA
jgi:hypothetical protein